MNPVKEMAEKYGDNPTAMESVNKLPFWVFFLFSGASVYLTRKKIADSVPENEKKAFWYSLGLGAFETLVALMQLPDKKYPTFTGALSGFLLYDALKMKQVQDLLSKSGATKTESASSTQVIKTIDNTVSPPQVKIVEILKEGQSEIRSMEIPTNIFYLEGGNIISRAYFKIFKEGDRVYYNENDRINSKTITIDEFKGIVEQAKENDTTITIVVDTEQNNIDLEAQVREIEGDMEFVWVCRKGKEAVNEYFREKFSQFYQCFRV